jgi:hypothetical protein
MINEKPDDYIGGDVPKWLVFVAWWTLGATLLAWIWWRSAL